MSRPDPIERGPDAPPFRAPWEAQAFALTVALYDRGLFTWSEWAETLGAEIRDAVSGAAADADGSDYYVHWLAATEKLVACKNLASSDALMSRKAAWDRAAHATPHGKEIKLENDPLKTV